MLTQPLMAKAFELAERLGMTAYELMDRMSMPEILDWIEYDQCHYGPEWSRHAVLCNLIETVNWSKGARKPNVKHYLPDVKTRPRKAKMTVDELRRRFNSQLGILSPNDFK